MEDHPNVFKVRYGDIHLDHGSDLLVTKVIRHQNFSLQTADYDVAVLHLAERFKQGPSAAVISLAQSPPEVDSEVRVTGWGCDAVHQLGPTTLQQGTMRVSNKSYCNAKWAAVYPITDRMLCTHSHSQSLCRGDSGGPLVWGNVQVGVASLTSSGFIDKPNVFANVATLRQWIVANLNQ